MEINMKEMITDEALFIIFRIVFYFIVTIGIIYVVFMLQEIQIENQIIYNEIKDAMELECQQTCLRNKKMVHSGDKSGNGFTCVCCSSEYSNDFLGNKYTECEKHIFYKENWVQK